MGCLGWAGAIILVSAFLGFHWMDGSAVTPNQTILLIIIGIVCLVLDRLLPEEKG